MKYEVSEFRDDLIGDSPIPRWQGFHIVIARKDVGTRDYKRVVAFFNTNAYLMNDKGDTVEILSRGETSPRYLSADYADYYQSAEGVANRSGVKFGPGGQPRF